MGTSSERFITELAAEHRLVAIGGLAIIAHGLSRKTIDGDFWLDPMTDTETWASALASHVKRHNSTTIHRLPRWQEIEAEEMAQAVEETGMIRLLGFDCPLDIFREPNETELEAFEGFCERGKIRTDGTILPDPLDLLQTKLETGREKDSGDIRFLEGLTRDRYREKLPTATLTEATDLLDRFSDWQVLQAALQNPDSAVIDLAHRHLREFAEAGDPFSQAILEGREIP